jgi:rhamnulokinase
VLENLQTLLGRKLTRIHIVGGGSRNMVLNQFVADATGIPVIAGPAEATVAGNILVQAMGSGEVKDLAEIRQVVKRSFDLTTIEPGSRSGWDAAYDTFHRIQL